MIHLKKVTKRGTYISTIEYSDLLKVSSLFGQLKIKFRNGKSLSLSGVPGKDRKFLIDFLQSVLPMPAHPDRKLPDVRNLCPKCFATVTAFPATCPSCHAGLKTPLKASLLSLLLPGLGGRVVNVPGAGYWGNRKARLLRLVCRHGRRSARPSQRHRHFARQYPLQHCRWRFVMKLGRIYKSK